MDKIRILIAEDDYPIAIQFKDYLYEQYPNKISSIEIKGRCDLAKKHLRDNDFDAVIWDINLSGVNCYSLIDEIKIKKPVVLIFSEQKDIINTLAKEHKVDFSSIEIDDVSRNYKNELANRTIQIGRICKDDPLSEDNLEVIDKFINSSLKKANPIIIDIPDKTSTPMQLSLYNIALITKPKDNFITVFNNNNVVSVYSELKHHKVIFLNDKRFFFTNTSKDFESFQKIKEKVLKECSDNFLLINDSLVNINNCKTKFTSETNQIEVIISLPDAFQEYSIHNYKVLSALKRQYTITLLPNIDSEYVEIERILKKLKRI